MKILIGSVHKNLNWFDIQFKYCQLTSCKFDYVIYLNGNSSPNQYVIYQNTKPEEARLEHIRGVRYLIDYFNKSDYNYFLLLDSDAFPIQRNWDNILINSMKDKNMACVIRYENLDTWPHPCVMLFNKQAKFEVCFDKIVNLVGYKCDEFNVKTKESYFPLIRTNKFNPHPILSAIYFNLFYHHGAGSRSFYNRAIHINQYYNDPETDKLLYNKIMTDSDAYIKSLI